jgi:alanyl-tRNA synthetase
LTARSNWSADLIRKTFIRFFEERAHKTIPSASLIPHGDPTLLFTTAGMVQFKPYFEGRAQPPAPRLCSVQKCFRTSDIDSVGDAGHLTFFEMLGNFSVGDYFKEGAIPWAWELVTESVGLPKERLWAAVYLDDDEAFDLWRKVGVPAERILRYGEEDNYWFSGDIGPCGPCSEIYYDFGPTPGCPECEKGTCHPQVDCHDEHGVGRFLELWNLVFMTYYQHEDGSRTPLPTKNIDTGAGLERWAAVLQGGGERMSVYETDLFRPIVAKVEELSGRKYGEDAATDRAMRIVAEHARAAAFLIADGVMPSNEGRGYSLRRVLRRGIYFAQKVNPDASYAAALGRTSIDLMAKGYPELVAHEQLIIDSLGLEEGRFRETLEAGQAILQDVINRLEAGAGGRSIPGSEVFRLYDTYGLPMELTAELASEHGVAVDAEGFEREMEAQRERARAAQQFGISQEEKAEAYASLAHLQTRFVGYETLRHETTVAGIVVGADAVESASEGDEAELVLRETPFYAESGGQVGDQGTIELRSSKLEARNSRFEVSDTQWAQEGLIVHRGRVVEGRIAVNDDVVAQVDPQKRADTMRNHTGTHLLHSALREVLGTHVRQAGSLVAPDRLRFDFTHMEALKPEELAAVQARVNEKIREDIPVETGQRSYDDAIASGALAFFGDKYAEDVRVVDVREPEAMNDERSFSRELCGGTHCRSTGQIGMLVIVKEESIGAGVRRIEALTGRAADEYVREQQATLERVAKSLGAAPDEVEAKLASLQQELAAAEKRLQALERQAARREAEALLEQAERPPEADGTAVVVSRVSAASPELMREMGDFLRDRLGSAVIALGAVVNDRPSFMVMATRDLTSRGLHAGDIVKGVAAVAGGGGGGRPDMAQAGGKDAAKLDDALAAGHKLIRERLGSLKEGPAGQS